MTNCHGKQGRTTLCKEGDCFVAGASLLNYYWQIGEPRFLDGGDLLVRPFSSLPLSPLKLYMMCIMTSG